MNYLRVLLADLSPFQLKVSVQLSSSHLSTFCEQETRLSEQLGGAASKKEEQLAKRRSRVYRWGKNVLGNFE